MSRAEGQEANVENQSGVENFNRLFVRRRVRNHVPQRRAQRMNPRTPQVLHPLDEMGENTLPDDPMQQRMQRMVVSQQQCMDRVAQVDTRLEQFRQAIRQDAFEIALTVQRVMQDVHGQGRGMEQDRHTLFNIVQEKVETLEARFYKYDEFVQTALDKSLIRMLMKCALLLPRSLTSKQTFENLLKNLRDSWTALESRHTQKELQKLLLRVN